MARGGTRKAHVSFLAAVAVVVSACAPAPLSMRPAPRSFTVRDYPSVYQAWTRESDEFAFGSLSNVLHVSATFQSWEFRRAYVVRFAADHGFTTEQRAAMLDTTQSDSEVRHRFCVTLAGPVLPESDLTDEDSAWRVLLVDDSGAQSSPVELEKVEPTAAERTYYPSVSPFRYAFRIAFDVTRPDGRPTISPDADAVRLRFVGPEGTVELVWALQG